MEIKGARSDVGDFFCQSGVVSLSKLNHTPFIVIDEKNGSVTIERRPDRLVSDYDPSCTVLCQWRGKYRSDFFTFTVAQFIERWEIRQKALRGECV